jgi:hypothetical protein
MVARNCKYAVNGILWCMHDYCCCNNHVAMMVLPQRVVMLPCHTASTLLSKFQCLTWHWTLCCDVPEILWTS